MICVITDYKYWHLEGVITLDKPLSLCKQYISNIFQNANENLSEIKGLTNTYDYDIDKLTPSNYRNIPESCLS